jgi:hypothetical protein
MEETTAGLNAYLQSVVDHLAAGGFEVFGIEPWGGGLPLGRRGYTVNIAPALPNVQKEPEQFEGDERCP